MPNLLIATHGPLSTALRDSAALIVGDTEGIDCFEMTADLPHDRAREVLSAQLARARARPDPLTVLVDVRGGSPFAIASEHLIEHGDFTLLTGVNLPMLLEALTSADPGADGLCAAGTTGIVHVNALLEETEACDA